MPQISKQRPAVSRRSRGAARTGLLGVLIAVVGLLFVASSASAGYEQAPEHFFGGGSGFEETPSAAVNVNGVGLPPEEEGSFYVAASANRTEDDRMFRFSSGAEGEAPSLRETWTNSFFQFVMGVAVDQATGDVYVLRQGGHGEQPVVEIFTATGTLIGGFGEVAEQGESIKDSPGKFHELFHGQAGIAVDEAGTVFVSDRDENGQPVSEREGRVMVWEPEHPGEYVHYVYAGRATDTTNAAEIIKFSRIVLIGDDRLVAGSTESINEYATGGGSTPICTFLVPGRAAQPDDQPGDGRNLLFVLQRQYRASPWPLR